MNCLLYPMQLFPKCIGWLARWLFAPRDDHRQFRGQVGQAPAAHKNWLWRQHCEALLFAYCWTERGVPRSEVLLLNTPGDDGYDLSSSVYRGSRNSRSPLSLPLPLGERSQHYRYVVWSFPEAATSACWALESNAVQAAGAVCPPGAAGWWAGSLTSVARRLRQRGADELKSQRWGRSRRWDFYQDSPAE